MMKLFCLIGIAAVGTYFLGFGFNQFCWAAIGAVAVSIVKD